MYNDLLYKIALTKVPHIGDVHSKILINQFHSAQAVFNTPKSQLEKIEGIGSIRANAIKQFKDFDPCEKELIFLEKHQIKVFTYQDEAYPKNLLRCDDCPSLLYLKGNVEWNEKRIISIVGTRLNTDYGKQCCEKLIEDLSTQEIIVVSGLAYGIDTIAHRTALKNGLQTIGVLAHGLDRIYPHQNKTLAQQMINQGGLLTDFCSGELPNKQNFPKRNRITSGICDALIVIETGIKGGSLITAEIANSYNKDVFAFPGRVTDPKSQGCNELIKSNKACLINDSNDLLNLLNWNTSSNSEVSVQSTLFYDYDENEKKIINCFKSDEEVHYDYLFYSTQLSNTILANSLLALEMNNIIKSLPGKRYRLSNY
jgi:DNA processing protein